jgi:hypothetical protein
VSLLNWAHAKKLIEAEATGRAKWRDGVRVSREWEEYIEGRIREIVKAGVWGAPTIGRTSYPPVRRKESVDG